MEGVIRGKDLQVVFFRDAGGGQVLPQRLVGSYRGVRRFASVGPARGVSFNTPLLGRRSVSISVNRHARFSAPAAALRMA